MPMTKQAGPEQFLSLLQEQYDQLEANPLARLRAGAWERLKECGLPTRNTEVYKYVPLRKLYNRIYSPSHPPELSPEKIANAILPGCEKSVLVLVNGQFYPSLSSLEAVEANLIVAPLHEAVRTYGAFLQNRWKQEMKVENDPFALINASLHSSGVFCYLPPGNELSTPLQVIHVQDAANSTHVMSRLHLFIGAQSKATVFTTTLSIDGAAVLDNRVIDIALEEGANLHIDSVDGTLPQETWQLNALRATLKRDAVLETVSLSHGSETIRNDYRVHLVGENSEARLYGLWSLADRTEQHTNVLMDHCAPGCRSTQLFKGVLRDFSQSSFEGKIYVHQAAQQTDAYQLNNNLLLSDGAHADSKPNLEIFADDVKASHGATVGQLPADQLLYLRTRGYDEETATQQLVEGYLQDVLDRLQRQR